MNIYSAEQPSGDLFMVAAWEGLDREGFKELVLENLSRNSIPEPDRDIQELALFEWAEDGFAKWFSPDAWGLPEAAATFKEANFATLYWTYPGSWEETQVTRMPPELAAQFWDGEGVDRSDPKHPDWHDTMAGIWDNREKGPS